MLDFVNPTYPPNRSDLPRQRGIMYGYMGVELFHALNRGVDKRNIFLDDQDRARFVHDMYEFNDSVPAGNTYRSFATSSDMVGFVNPTSRTQRDMLVDIHSRCLMDNHYHLLISERTEGGITKFLRKLNVGYANYFNEKYERSGTLFQGRTKKILIDSDAHFLHILHYIHLNPLDFLTGAEGWRTRKLVNAKEALAHLRAYRWSNYLDYCDTHNFPSVVTMELFRGVFGNYEKVIAKYIRDIERGDLQAQKMTLE